MQNFRFNNLYEIVEHNFKSHPNKTIVYEEDIRINNAKFKEYVDTVASFLIQLDIKPNNKVALIMSNSWQYIVNIFAISKIGAVVVPVNSFFKADEIAYVLNDSKAELLFSSQKFAEETKNLISKTNIKKIVWVDGCPVENEKNINYDSMINQPLQLCSAHTSTT